MMMLVLHHILIYFVMMLLVSVQQHCHMLQRGLLNGVMNDVLHFDVPEGEQYPDPQQLVQNHSTSH